MDPALRPPHSSSAPQQPGAHLLYAVRMPLEPRSMNRSQTEKRPL